MKLKKFYLQGRHDGLPFDRQKKLHFTYGFDVVAAGKRYQQRGYVTKDEAEKVALRIKNDSRNKKYGIRPETEEPYLFDLFQTRLDRMDKGPDRSRAKRVLNAFLRLLPKDIKPSELRTRDFESYIQQRKDDGVSNATIRRELVPVISTLNNARKFYEALEDYRPPIIDRPQISKVRRNKTINFSEQNLIMQHLCRPRQLGETERFAAIRHTTADLLQFLLLTAGRVGEIAGMTKSDVDLHSNIVRIKHPKTQNRKDSTSFLPINEAMRQILYRRFAVAKNEWLFAERGKVTPSMRRALKEACEFNGIKFGKNEFDGISFNRTRHTATTDMVMAGTDLKTVGLITGHSDENMTMHYAHVDPAKLENASAVLATNRGQNYFQDEPFPDTDREEVTSILN